MKGDIIVCPSCGLESKLYCKGICRLCYTVQYEAPECICWLCGKRKPHKALGMCSRCYDKWKHRQYQYGETRKQRDKRLAYHKKWWKLNKERINAERRRRRAVQSINYMEAVGDIEHPWITDNKIIFRKRKRNTEK